MKKRTVKKKLELGSVTIKPLTEAKLDDVAGGKLVAFSEADSCTCKCG